MRVTTRLSLLYIKCFVSQILVWYSGATAGGKLTNKSLQLEFFSADFFNFWVWLGGQAGRLYEETLRATAQGFTPCKCGGSRCNPVDQAATTTETDHLVGWINSLNWYKKIGENLNFKDILLRVWSESHISLTWNVNDIWLSLHPINKYSLNLNFSQIFSYNVYR